MRAAVLFFLSLCFLLLIGADYGNSGTHHSRIDYLPAQNSKATQNAKFSNTSQDFSITKSINLSEEKVYLINVEDEDEDLVSVRKYVLLVKYFVTLASISLLIYFYNYFKNRLPFCHHLSYILADKHILQRALRI